MQSVRELARHPSPAGRPQPLAFHAGTLWVGCLDTSRLYAVDPKTWSVLDEVAAPGKPFGMTTFGGALRVVISLGADDDRYLYRFVPGHGFELESKTACPDLTGSHLTSDGTHLYLLQIGNQRIIKLDADGSIVREINLPTSCAGISFDSADFYMISADDEFDELNLATIDITLDHPALEPVASMSPDARALAFDGNAFWTSYRDQNEIVSFAVDDVPQTTPLAATPAPR